MEEIQKAFAEAKIRFSFTKFSKWKDEAKRAIAQEGFKAVMKVYDKIRAIGLGSDILARYKELGITDQPEQVKYDNLILCMHETWRPFAARLREYKRDLKEQKCTLKSSTSR